MTVQHEEAVASLLAFYRARYQSPFSVAQLRHKHYGTHVIDGEGVEVAQFWTAEGDPSAREKARFNGQWTPEFWAVYRCDSHWECEADLAVAEAFVLLLNDLGS